MYRYELADRVFDEFTAEELAKYYLKNYEEYAIDLSVAIVQGVCSNDIEDNQLKIEFGDDDEV